ncbi:MAG: sensor histidine kinase [Anaerolineae bacterium]
MTDSVPFEAELFERIHWLIRLRWIAVLGTGLALFVASLWFPDGLPWVPLVSVTGAIALYNTLFFRYAHQLERTHPAMSRSRQASRLALAQIILDFFALATLIHFSGGIENPLALFFVFHTIIASILLSRRTSYGLAILGNLLFAAIAGLEYSGLVSHHHLPILGSIELYRDGPYLLVVVGAMTVTLCLVAYMTSSITLRLRDRDQALLKSNQTILAKSQELATANERLRQIDAERTRFMVLVTHELRAPINTIYSCLDAVLTGSISPETGRDLLERARQRASELTELVSDLLRLTRVREEAARQEELELVQVDEELNHVVELMKVEANKKGLSLKVEIEPELAPVQANAERLKMIWTNLMSNAIRYTRPGGLITVTLRQTPTHLVGTVHDTGIGIPAEDLARIFEEFYRAENARAISPVGTGVGLAIVRRILENYGGKIQVESELGHGSTFTFFLPRADR